MSQDADERHNNWSGMTAKEACKEIAYGSVAGMVAEIFEYPFDLAKVRLQSQLLYSADEGSTLAFKGPLDCLNQTWAEEGFRGLYRGVSVPLIGSMAQTAGLFLAYSSFQNAIQNYYHPDPSPHGVCRKPHLTTLQLGVAAAGAGFLTSFILTPMELVKCRMQVQMMNMHSQTIRHHPKSSPICLPTTKLFSSPTHLTKSTSAFQPTTFKSPVHNLSTTRSLSPPSPYTFSPPNTSSLTLKPSSPLSIIRSILRDHGFKGFWLGQTGTMVRETGGCTVWFVVKEVVTDTLQKRRCRLRPAGTAGNLDQPLLLAAKPVTDILPWESAIAGATAGAAGALLFYPADTVKSAIQTEEELRSPSQRVRSTSPSTFWRTASKMYRAYGLKGFYAGCGMTVARSVPSSGIIFVAYDGLRQWFD